AVRAKGRLARAPVEKLSSTRTRTPSERRRSTRWEPMKPAPPVTRNRSATRRLQQLPGVALSLLVLIGYEGSWAAGARSRSVRPTSLAVRRRGGPVDLSRLLDHRPDGEIAPDPRTPGPSHAAASLWIVEQRSDRGGERPRVAGRHEEARLAVFDDVAVAWHVGCDDGEPGAHRLEDCERQPFLERRGHVEVEGRVDTRRIVEPAGKDHALAEPRRRDLPTEALRLGPVAHQEERDAGAVEELESAHERVEPLDGIESRDRAQNGDVGPQAQTRARERRGRHAPVLLVEVHAVDHGREPVRRGESEPPRLRLLRRRNVDHRVGPAREAPLEAEVEWLERAPVALVVDAVERVDGGRAGPARGQAPV